MIKLPVRQARFLKRNEGLTTIIGALLMFLTFVVNNVFREKIKSFKDSLNAAQTTFLIRDSNLQLYREIDELEARVAQGNAELMQSLPKPRNRKHVTLDPEAVLPHTSVEVLRLTNETWYEFNNLDPLIEKMRSHDSRVRDFNALYKEFDAVRIGMLKPVTPIGNGKEKALDPIAYNRAQQEDYFAVLRIHDKLQMLAANILDEARSDAEQMELRFKALTPLSYVLLLIGLALTVITRLAGIEELPAQGE